MNTPRVFISYSHDSPEHDRKVMGLANRLREEGIDCMIDQYEPAPAFGWPRWMECQIREANFVLMVCTEVYYRRVVGEEEPDKGFGVCWEAGLIYNALYRQKLENDKFIPTLFSKADEQYIPEPLQGYTYYQAFFESGYNELYRRLTNQPKTIKPDLGKLRPLPALKPQTNFFAKAVIHNLPFDENNYFFGREEFLTELHNIFSSGESADLTQAITGLGGVGKTQIALAYAYKYADNYRVIWWVRAENPVICDTDYYDFARAMSFKDSNAERDQVIRYVRKWLENNTDWLFIFDNAIDYSAIQEYLPRFKKGHILITSRNNQFEQAKRLPVDVFPPEVAVDFLKFRAELREEDGSLELAQELGGLPLALEQAAAYMVENRINCRRYLELFHKYNVRLFSEEKPPVGYHDTVLTTWKISLERITDQAALQLLYLSAFLNPERITKQIFVDGISTLPQPLAEAIGDELYFNRIMTQLETYSLIQRRENDIWSIHRLLQEVVQDALGEESADWAKFIIELVGKICDDDYYQMKTGKKSEK